MTKGRDHHSRLAELDHEHVWHPFTQQQRWTASRPLIVERADGSHLYDVEGRAYLDGVSSLWTNVHGHRHPRLDAAVREQLDRVAHSTFLGLTHPPGIELAHRLVGLAPWGLKRVFYSDNGSTATEVALKMAFQYQQQIGQTGRTRFASLCDAYHGDTIGAVSVGSIPLFHRIYRPMLFDAVALPAPVEPGGDEEQAALERALALLEEHGESLAALIVEPLVQGAAGMKMHTRDYLRPILEKARSLGVLVIADEVAVGFGRTGTLFAMEQVGFTPDFLCLAKGLAAGYLPLAATLTTETVYEAFLGESDAHRQFFHGHTFTANPLACAVALANLDLFEETDLVERTREAGRHLSALLAGLRERTGVGSIRQTGLMVGIDLVRPDGSPHPSALQMGHRVCMRARELGAILRPLGDTIVINPPLSIEDADLTALVRITTDAIVAEQAS